MQYFWQLYYCLMADIQELLMTRSVLALVNGQPWDMHKPLTEDCELRFLHFKDEDPSLSNKVYTSSLHMFVYVLYGMQIIILIIMIVVV